MEQASSSTQLTVIDIVELLNKPLLGTLVAVLAGEHDAIPPKHGKSRGENPAAELMLWKGRYFEVWPRDMRNFTSRAVNSLSQRAKLASAASSKAARSACCRA